MGWGTIVIKERLATPEAAALWTRRAEALEAGTLLLSGKPDRELWTADDRRLFRYALAVSRRMDKLQ